MKKWDSLIARPWTSSFAPVNQIHWTAGPVSWDQNENGYGDSDALDDEFLEDDLQEAFVPEPWKGSTQVYQSIERALVRSYQNKRKSTAPVTRRSVIFSNGRREHVLRSLGYPPVFYPRPLNQLKSKQEQVHLYIDVSGSMLSDSVLNFIFGLTLHLKDDLGPHLYQFTTQVRTVTLDQIKQGQLISGGTDINPVIRHALKNKFERILVITDGYFDPVHSDLIAQARQCGFYAGFLLTEPHYQEWYIEDLFEYWNLKEDLKDFNREQFNAPSFGRVGRRRGSSGWGNGRCTTKKKDQNSGQKADGAISLPMPNPIQIKWGCSPKNTP